MTNPHPKLPRIRIQPLHRRQHVVRRDHLEIIPVHKGRYENLLLKVRQVSTDAGAGTGPVVIRLVAYVLHVDLGDFNVQEGPTKR